jgi:hypothetical protein
MLCAVASATPRRRLPSISGCRTTYLHTRTYSGLHVIKRDVLAGKLRQDHRGSRRPILADFANGQTEEGTYVQGKLRQILRNQVTIPVS